MGSHLHTLGLGSLAGSTKENQDAVSDVITSCDEHGEFRKGRMLSHFFYRAFLSYIYNSDTNSSSSSSQESLEDSSQGPKERLAAAKALFESQFALIWKQTYTGVTRTKRNDGNTPEPCATSLLAAYITQGIAQVCHDAEVGTACLPAWSSEYVLYASGPAKQKVGKKSAMPKRTGARKNPQPDDGSKQPRCDGLLTMPDPLTNESLRGLVMMEAKIESFTIEDDYQSRSNAADVMLKKPHGEDDPWPLLVFHLTMNQLLP